MLPPREKLYCAICEREGHTTQNCWYNAKNRDQPHSVVLVEEEVMLGQIKLLRSKEDHHFSVLQEDHGEIVIIKITRTTREEETKFSLVCTVVTPIIGLV